MALVERPRPYARPEKVLLTPEEFNSLEQRLLSTRKTTKKVKSRLSTIPWMNWTESLI